MTISATIIADSVSTVGPRKRLTTMQLRYPRFIHAEFMTHRMFSRNASSSRAIPVTKLIQDVLDNTAMPIHWGKNQPGMQAQEEHEGLVEAFSVSSMSALLERGHTENGYEGPAEFTKITCSATEAWLIARDQAIAAARAFTKAGYHKQIVNRLLEPFSHINVVVTATEWTNFFALRDHPDAQPEIRALAQAMKTAMAGSTPIEREPEYGRRADSWHLPYVSNEERTRAGRDNLIRMSVARCARVSYLTTESKTPTISEDLALYERLVGSAPLHASPAEHQASPDDINLRHDGWEFPEMHGNFIGWIQYRKSLPNENII